MDSRSSLALAPNLKAKGRYVVIPPTDYPPLEQAVVIVKSSEKKATAKQFLAFIKTPPKMRKKLTKRSARPT